HDLGVAGGGQPAPRASQRVVLAAAFAGGERSPAEAQQRTRLLERFAGLVDRLDRIVGDPVGQLLDGAVELLAGAAAQPIRDGLVWVQSVGHSPCRYPCGRSPNTQRIRSPFGTLPFPTDRRQGERMSSTDDLLANNESYAASFDKADLALPPAKKVAVLACMDARLDVGRALGLSEGDAHVIRNAGGVVTDDAIRS